MPHFVTSFSASPSSITLGQSSVLSWEIHGKYTLFQGGGVGSIETGQSTDTSGSSFSRTVSPTVTTTYTLQVSGSALSGHGSDYINRTITITVTAAAIPTTASLSVSPSSVSSGGYVTVAWSIANATTLTAKITGQGFSSPFESLPLSGSRSVGPITQNRSWTLSYNDHNGDLQQIVRSVSIATSVVTSHTDYTYRRGTSTPSTPTGGTSTNHHVPSGWSNTSLSATTTQDVYRSSRTEYFEDSSFDYASSWQAPILWRARTGSVTTTYTDYVYRRGTSTPSTPTGGTNTEDHLPSGWSNSQLTATSTLNVYRSTRTEYFIGQGYGNFDYASSWGTPILWRAKTGPEIPTIAIGNNDYNVSIGSSEIVAISIGDTEIS